MSYPEQTAHANAISGTSSQTIDASPPTNSSHPRDLHGFHFDRFLKDKSGFEPRDGHRTIELDEAVDGLGMRLSDSEISETDISAWLHKGAMTEGGARKRLRLLFFSPRGDYKSFRPLPVSQDTFKDIFNVLKLPALFLRVLLSNLPLAMRFTPKNGRENSNEKVGLILRTDAFSFAQYALCLVHDPSTGCTSGVCVGLCIGEIKEFLLFLKASIHLGSNYMLVPMVFVDFMSHMTARWLSYNRLSLLAIGKSKEIRVREPKDTQGLVPDSNLDLDTATRKLTFLTDEYSITESISKTQLRFLDLIEGMLKEQRKLSLAEPNAPGTEGAEIFLDQAYYSRESFKSALQYIERDRQSIQGLMQTTYCLIAQKESRQNLVIAKASGRIADESRKVAIWTRRDSTDMRIITIITMLFLPGTFTATFFGSSFFDFNINSDSRVVSTWIWLYSLVTGVLTAAIFAGWFAISQYQNKKMVRKLRIGNDEQEMFNLNTQNTAITGFWTTRGSSGVWGERVIRVERTLSNDNFCGRVSGVHSDKATCGDGGGCGGCGGGCGGG